MRRESNYFFNFALTVVGRLYICSWTIVCLLRIQMLVNRLEIWSRLMQVCYDSNLRDIHKCEKALENTCCSHLESFDCIIFCYKIFQGQLWLTVLIISYRCCCFEDRKRSTMQFLEHQIMLIICESLEICITFHTSLLNKFS